MIMTIIGATPMMRRVREMLAAAALWVLLRPGLSIQQKEHNVDV